MFLICWILFWFLFSRTHFMKLTCSILLLASFYFSSYSPVSHRTHETVSFWALNVFLFLPLVPLLVADRSLWRHVVPLPVCLADTKYAWWRRGGTTRVIYSGRVVDCEVCSGAYHQRWDAGSDAVVPLSTNRKPFVWGERRQRQTTKQVASIFPIKWIENFQGLWAIRSPEERPSYTNSSWGFFILMSFAAVL